MLITISLAVAAQLLMFTAFTIGKCQKQQQRRITIYSIGVFIGLALFSAALLW